MYVYLYDMLQYYFQGKNIGSIQEARPFQRGIPRWNSNVEFHVRLPSWNSKVEFHVGSLTWNSALELKLEVTI